MSHRQHHYVPRFLLERWHTLPDNKLSQFQWMRGRLIHERYTAKSVAKQQHLYSRRRDGPDPDVVLECDFLGPHVDEPAAAVHKLIISNGVRSLTDDHKRTWARFLVSLLLRTPGSVANIRAKGRAVLEAGLDDDPDGYRDVRGGAPEESLKEWVQKHRPWEFDDLGVNALPSLVGSEVLNTALLKSNWATRPIQAASRDLLIGDKPLLYVGRMETSFLIILPLSPSRAFFAFNNKDTWGNIGRNSDKAVLSHINRAMVGAADQYIYSTGIQHQRLVQKYLRRPH